jgi:hypothetical protein
MPSFQDLGAGETLHNNVALHSLQLRAIRLSGHAIPPFPFVTGYDWATCLPRVVCLVTLIDCPAPPPEACRVQNHNCEGSALRTCPAS